MTKPRKPYKPRPVSSTGGLRLLIDRKWKSMPLSDERQANVVISCHTSIDALCGGYALTLHADTIIYAVNIGRLLAMRGLGEEYIEQISEAQQAMIRCIERFKVSGKYELDDADQRAVREATDVYEAQLAIASQAELQGAIAEMHKRLGLEKVTP